LKYFNKLLELYVLLLPLQPNRGYKANLISTIVDLIANVSGANQGYKANLISTIVDN